MKQSKHTLVRPTKASLTSTPRWCAVGIDPGRTGGVAALWSDGHAQVIGVDTNDPAAVEAALPSKESALRVVVALEKVTAMVIWARKTCFALGRALGTAHGVVSALDWPTEFLPPKEWQKDVPGDIPKDKDERKRYFVDQACKAFGFPDLKSGEADALWIAWAAARRSFLAESA